MHYSALSRGCPLPSLSLSESLFLKNLVFAKNTTLRALLNTPKKIYSNIKLSNIEMLQLSQKIVSLATHFIDKECKYQKWIICFSVVANQKGRIITSKVEKILRKLRLKNLSTIKMDNASSNDVVAGL